ncbi:hypothetical protein HKBW3S03_00055 [Candidatus Hakubella thermalkaliphila]|uniref:Methyltransferase n=3 Tax=Candidatus Hakubella thermalkaliphila TaxID=2754717 RepID=A0A6V8NH06_9ACTN|nr:Modification methylase MboII [Bacillota bacterium]GFP18550.1 hypothetical protein HKBW3S03_00055 [Candidatus Hakubella thermalkaliphila]GFP30015.1 hypothetical protein HKBW3S34_00935 [Candidatus Hakubella thermalkaliphila]GFP37120.1 hypothetical protein HKBW3S44_00800 [Candidatus Hakubella thermalkaliphila]GFP39141.1 hypothetical protein HKBW3S47_00841 [Candidatus Hakubella thermalkaliphila]
MVNSAKEVRKITQKWIEQHLADVKDFVSLGLPEIDDRYNVWRVPIVLSNATSHLIGEAKIGLLGNVMDSTRPELIRTRAKRFINEVSAPDRKRQELFYPAPIPNKVILGDAMKVLEELPPDTAQLVITSPPYYNAKPESCEFIDYQEYLNFLRGVIIRIREVLSEGRFFTINVSPVLVRRTSRSTSSKRIPIPFDVHQIMASAGFEFIDDIIWVKPEGAGWNLGRGRRFAADRQPLQYKPVSVTEYVLVYRKKTTKLIDWNIRKHYDSKLVEQSRILGDYDVTNVWHIPPGHHKRHPAVFPDELVHKLIRYYSFIDDLVLDPFAGSGTVGRVAIDMNRRFLLIDNNPKYFHPMKEELSKLAITRNIRVDYEVSDHLGEANDS